MIGTDLGAKQVSVFKMTKNGNLPNCEVLRKYIASYILAEFCRI